MYFELEDDALVQHELLNVVSRELFAFTSSFDGSYRLRSIPTHTEDGIPIRKIYVTNLPPKTTRNELFGVFAQYGFIKSCWIRMGDRAPNRNLCPAYAFVTFSNPADAHKALQAPYHERALRGRNLRISPADSWHQPAEDSEGRVLWKSYGQQSEDMPSPSNNNDKQANGISVRELSDQIEPETDGTATVAVNDLPKAGEKEVENTRRYCLLDILNADCVHHILRYVSLRDLIRSERVSKRWRMMIQEYIHGMRVYKTSWWQHVPVTLTTAVLRRVLQKVGHSLLRLHIDHNWSALNDRTAHTIGKYCPHLEELKVMGMHTKNWNPLVYGCKNLRRLIFVSCNKLTDASLIHLIKSDCPLEYLAIANNTHVTGLFLTGSCIRKLTALSFYNCYSLQGAVLNAAIESMSNITTLKLDVCPITMWKIIPLILKKVPKLEELSLSEYTSIDQYMKPYEDEHFCEALANLKLLKILNLSRNIYITNSVLKQVARSCPNLQSLNVSSCNSRKGFLDIGNFRCKGVSDDGIAAVCRSCLELKHLDVSYLALLTDNGLAYAARAINLTTLIARGNPALSVQPFALCLAACHELKEIDVCGCDSVSEEIIVEALKALGTHPRMLVLRLAGTPAGQVDARWHPLLTVNVDDDRSNPHLRPDFVDRIFDNSSEDSFDDIYEQDDIDDFLAEDDDFEDDEFLDNYEDILRLGVHPPDIMML
ncbi:F-box/LRR-repeat protein 7-like isoform X2 [Battus philenor]|uniref:F-box/LRR-repeat protein 7-like isoform X2 n=1 Tax=Battus philenor TaxID=42288 RepID=UPI0035CEBD9B